MLGVVTPIGDQGGDIAKTAALAAGYPETVAGVQLNRFCASGLEAVNQAAMRVRSGFEDLILAGGVESMSRVPMGSDGGAWAMDPATALSTGFVPQGIGADLIATLEGWTRERRRRVRRRVAPPRRQGLGQRLLRRLGRAGQGPQRPDRPRPRRADPPRHHAVEGLAGLKPSFAQIGADAGFDDVALEKYHWVPAIDHVHHAGNSSGHRRRRRAHGDRHRAGRPGPRPHPAGPDPRRPPSPAPTRRSCSPARPPPTRKALAKAGLEVDDIDLFEMNEAFAAVAMRFMQDMGISHEVTNVNGGAIAMGHPLGATGAMILGTLIDELQRRDLRRGLATLCVGGGMGIATIVELV